MSEQQKIIYIADDDEDDRLLFFEAVLDLNLPAAVVETSSGDELLQALYGAEYFPDVIFLDINMPGKSGFDCLAEIRNAEGNLKNVKIIILSTSSNQANIRLADELGADFYAVKPSSFQGLKNLIQEVLSNDWNHTSSKKKFLLA